jgi:hypothetical protein
MTICQNMTIEAKFGSDCSYLKILLWLYNGVGTILELFCIFLTRYIIVCLLQIVYFTEINSISFQWVKNQPSNFETYWVQQCIAVQRKQHSCFSAAVQVQGTGAAVHYSTEEATQPLR